MNFEEWYKKFNTEMPCTLSQHEAARFAWEASKRETLQVIVREKHNNLSDEDFSLILEKINEL